MICKGPFTSVLRLALALLLIVCWGVSLIYRFKKKGIKAVLVSIVTVLLIAYLGLAVILYFMQSRFLYQPMRQVPYTPADLGLAFEKVVLTTQDGLKLTGWFIPARKPVHGARDPGHEMTILFCHGNGGNMAHRLDSINIFQDLGLNCFIFDYRGYGASQGKPDEQGTYLDAAAAYHWLLQQKKIPPQKIIFFGRSLGGSIAANLAASVKAAGLVVESAFTSYADIGKKFYPYMPVRFFASFNYDTVDFIKQVHCPVMLIYSRDDEIMPFEFGLRLYEAANEPKEFVEIYGSHNDSFLNSGESYRHAWTDWLKFLKEYKPQAKPVLRRIP